MFMVLTNLLLISSEFWYFRHVHGICEYVATKMKRMHGLVVDPVMDIVICCGQSEAFAATMFASMCSICTCWVLEACNLFVCFLYYFLKIILH